MVEQYNEVLNGRAHVNIGKNGLTEGTIEHINTQMKQKKIIKVKILKEFAQELGMDHYIAILLEKLKIYIYDVRGFTIVISKRKLPGVNIPKRYAKLVPTKAEK
jgi:RNA-binding protein YhbY